MKMVHPNVDYCFDFQKNYFYSFVIENADEYFKLTKQLISQSEGGDGEWVLSEILPIDLTKNTLVLFDFYNISCNNKKMESLLKNRILNLSSQIDISEILTRINKDFIDLTELIISNLDFSVDANNEITFEILLKIIKFNFNEEKTLLEKIISFIGVYCQLVPIKLVVLIGLGAVLNAKDIEKLIKEIDYKDIKIMFIDSCDNEICHKENKIIIDKDLCLI